MTRETLLHMLAVIVGAGLAQPIGLAADDSPISFGRDIRPILNKHCTGCHGGVKQAGKLSLIYRDKVVGPKGVVVPGHPEASELLKRMTTSDPDDRMPPPDEHPEPLPDEAIQLVHDWIKLGAAWDEHWSFTAPKRRDPPKVTDSSWVRSPIDQYVLAELESKGVQPAGEASREQWLRRVSFDLIGLPPSMVEIDQFVADESEDAYQSVVDRLLASPRFGERWASMWLDLARYADSMGYERDPGRIIWPYRDWVIRALNNDMPFNEFTVKQIAGDLLPNATLDDLIATGFHRNSQTNTEGGTDDEEFRIAAMVDRVNTTWTVWQGFNFGCVQCHNHPYAAVPNVDFYRFAAFFNNALDCDQRDDFPTVRVPSDPKRFAESRELRQSLDATSQQIMTPLQAIASKASWRAAKFDKIDSNKPQARLAIRNFKGQDEVIANGTVAQRSVYTVTARSPLKQVSAIRVEVPLLEGDSDASPSPAFVVTKSKVAVTSTQGGKPSSVNVPVSFVVGDHLDGMFWPPSGWGAFPNQFHDRWAVLVLDKPVSLEDGQRLSVTFEQNRGRDGAAPPALRRFRMSVTNTDGWLDRLASADHKTLTAKRNDLSKRLNSIGGVKMPVMQERPSLPRQMVTFERGNWLVKGTPVSPGTPAIMPRLDPEVPADRAAMAKWLVNPENPLTARVAVNRFWGLLFGIGIVETMEDFGPTGTLPSHPLLLDYLALQFQGEYGWSLKRLVREVVLSATYRQDSTVTPDAVRGDPRNRLLARGPRTRLAAEMIRDSALALGGLLSAKMYGPSVMPPQPEGVWQTVYSGAKWKTSSGEDRYRRALYTYWRRSMPYPSFLSFDASSRQVCSPRRITTNTPLQALVTMNDPVYVEASAAFAKRIMASGSISDPAQRRERLAFAVRLATSRAADESTIDILDNLFTEARSHYAAHSDDAKAVGGTVDEAAMALVANTIMNLDASLTK